MLHPLGDFAEGPPPYYERHKPETTLLYQIVEEYWPSFKADLCSQGKHLPHFVSREWPIELSDCVASLPKSSPRQSDEKS